jgi:hypothetical protein
MIPLIISVSTVLGQITPGYFNTTARVCKSNSNHICSQPNFIHTRQVSLPATAARGILRCRSCLRPSCSCQHSCQKLGECLVPDRVAPSMTRPHQASTMYVPASPQLPAPVTGPPLPPLQLRCGWARRCRPRGGRPLQRSSATAPRPGSLSVPSMLRVPRRTAAWPSSCCLPMPRCDPRHVVPSGQSIVLLLRRIP